MSIPRPPKIPRSVLVVIHTPEHRVLLLERADHPGFWQSVTGSLDAEDEPLAQTALRELAEETGLQPSEGILSDWHWTNRYEIFAHWRHRYAEGVTHNTEHVFGFEVPHERAIVLAPREHLSYRWLPWEAAAEACFSWSNADAIRRLGAGLASGAGPGT